MISGQITYFYSVSGENQSGTRSAITLNQSPFDINGLIPDTSYTFNFIRDISINNTISESITSLDFRTAVAGSASDTNISSDTVTQLINSGYTLQNIIDNIGTTSTYPVTIILSSDLNNITNIVNHTSHSITPTGKKNETNFL